MINHRIKLAQLQNQIKLLPIQLEINKKQELDIYNEEIENINSRTQEAIQYHINKLIYLDVAKSQLAEQIQELQNKIAESQSNISRIQENAHAYRKNTLLELQKKKQQKVEITTVIDELNKTKDLYNTNQDEVSSRLNNLIEFKMQIINTYYSDPTNILKTTNARDILSENILQMINTSNINPGELLNIIISYIDQQIQDVKYQLSSISKKATRLDKNITITSDNLQANIQPSSRLKTISYKDNYKNAKLQKTTLDSELSNLQSMMNSWNVEVIDKAKLEHNSLLDSLESEKQRAQERLNIMTYRLGVEYNSNNASLVDNIKLVETNIATTNNSLKATNEELALILREIANKKTKQTELEKINAKISNMELDIEKLKLDITSISS
jgi:chromosome segregation ATPase